MDVLHLPSTKAKIGSMYLGTITTDVWCLAYSIIFLLRRTLFVAFTFGLYNYPSLQVHLFIYSNVYYLIYLNKVAPHEDPFYGAVEVINEVLFMIACYHYVYFTNVIYDPFLRK